MEIESIIQFLYEQIQMRKKTSPKYKEIAKVYSTKRNEFEATLDKEQKLMLEELLLLKGDTDIQEMKEYFEQGFLFSAKLIMEIYNRQTVDLSEF